MTPKPTFRNPTGPALIQIRLARTCQGRERRAWVLAGFSGHGFKFGAVIGETRRSPSYSSGHRLGRRQG
jgi:hypothetical protein